MPFSYFGSNIYLDFEAYFFERNNEKLLVQQDFLYLNDFPSIFLPRKKENWINSSVMFTTKEDRERVKEEKISILVETPVGTEFFYNTADFTNPKRDLKTRINSFVKNYSFTLNNIYDKDDVLFFYDFWKKQRAHESLTFEESEEFFMFCLDNIKKYNIQQVYVEIGGRLAGLAWGVRLKNNWVGLHLKVDYQYKGLSRFLHSERAKLFKDCGFFTLGTGAYDSGIESYKKELGPIRTTDYSYILTSPKT